MKRIAGILAAFVLSVASFAATTADVKVDKAGSSVSLTGEVAQFSPSRSERAPNSITLRDTAGQVRVCVWPDVFAQVAGRAGIVPGAKVAVTGEIAEFRGAAEVHVKDAAGLKVLGADAAAPVAQAAAPAVAAAAPRAGITPIAQLATAEKKKNYTIRGTVASARAPRTETAPFVIKVQDAGAAVDLVFWKDTAEQLIPAQKVEVGDQVQVTGSLDEYRGTLQLRLEAPGNLKTQKSDPALFQNATQTTPTATMAPAAPQAGAADAKGLPTLAEAAVDSRASVSGKVANVVPVRLGRRVEVVTPAGPTQVLVWDTADSGNPAVRKLAASQTIEVAGVVKDVAGTRTLVVSEPAELISIAN